MPKPLRSTTCRLSGRSCGRRDCRCRCAGWSGWSGFNFGRQRANYFGSFGITSVAAYGAGELHALSPGPFIVSYGVVGPDQTIDVVIRWDHRVTDAAMIAKALTRLEQVLNGAIAAELLSHRQPAEPKAVRAVAT